MNKVRKGTHFPIQLGTKHRAPSVVDQPEQVREAHHGHRELLLVDGGVHGDRDITIEVRVWQVRPA